MNTPVYEKGTIKVVWIEDDEPSKIYSKMFNDEAKAEEFAKPKKDYIIFSLITQKNMEDFSWQILPYGQYRLYNKLVDYYKKYKGSNLLKLFSL